MLFYQLERPACLFDMPDPDLGILTMEQVAAEIKMADVVIINAGR